MTGTRKTPDARAKALALARAAIAKKALGSRILDLEGLSDVADYFFICSGSSERHVQTITEALVIESKRTLGRPLSVEGLTEGRWALVDLGDVIAHVFLDPLREFYDLESLWSRSRPVSIPPEFFTERA